MAARSKIIVALTLALVVLAHSATTIIKGPTQGGVAAAPPFVPVGPNPNNPNGKGGSQGSKHTRPLGGSMIDWGDPITSGLIGCWLCNENGGLKLYDIARSRHATLNGDVPSQYWGVGTVDGFSQTGRGVFIRNSATSYGEVSSFSLGANDITVMMWYFAEPNTCAWSSGNACLINKEPVNNQWLLLFTGGNLVWRPGGTGADLSTTRPTDVIWHQVVGTAQGTSGVLYVDGISKASGTTVAITDSTSALEFGRFINNFYYCGSIGPIYIWNRALNPQEVKELYDFPYRFIY